MIEKHACEAWDLPFCQDYFVSCTPNWGLKSLAAFYPFTQQQVEKQILLTAHTYIQLSIN